MCRDIIREKLAVYVRAGTRAKTDLISSLVTITGMQRKAVIRALNREKNVPRAQYRQNLVGHATAPKPMPHWPLSGSSMTTLVLNGYTMKSMRRYVYSSAMGCGNTRPTPRSNYGMTLISMKRRTVVAKARDSCVAKYDNVWPSSGACRCSLAHGSRRVRTWPN